MPQHRHGLGPHERGRLVQPLGRGEPGEAAYELGVRLLPRAVLGGGVRGRFGEGREEGAGAGGGVGGGEAGPVDPGHGERGLVVGQGPGECGHGQFGAHGEQAAAGEVVLGLGGVGQHAGLRPGAPGHGGGGETTGAAGLCQRVEGGVGGGVGGLPGAAPDAGDGGEQHERVQLGVGQQLVQVYGSGRLRPYHFGELLGRGLRERPGVDDTGGVHHGGDRVLPEQGGERFAVGHVTSHREGLGTGLGQLRHQLGGARRGGAAAAGEQQSAHALSGEPAGHVAAQRTGATGDEYGAVGPPDRLRGLRAARGAGHGAAQPAAETAGAADRDLVLDGVGGQRGHEPGSGAVVQQCGQVGQSAPALRVLQRGHPAETPYLGACGVRQPVGATDGHRAPGEAPDGGVDPGVLQGLEEHEQVGGAQE